MIHWADFEERSADFALRTRAAFEARIHHILATIRNDGSPRLGGIEVIFSNGDLWVGSMTGSRKTGDLRRDPRFALHTGPVDPPDFQADFRVSGRMIEERDEVIKTNILGPDLGGDLFRAEIAEVISVRIGSPPDHLVIESWTPDAGLRSSIRR